MRCTLSALAFSSLLAGPAFASGNLGCEVNDAAIELNIESGVTRGLGEPIFNFRGEMTVKDQSISEDLRQVAFDRSHLAQYWLEGADLRLRIYRDIEGKTVNGSVELVVKTEASDDEGGFEGRYRLTVFDSAKAGSSEGIDFEGAVTCFAG